MGGVNQASLACPFWSHVNVMLLLGLLAQLGVRNCLVVPKLLTLFFIELVSRLTAKDVLLIARGRCNGVFPRV